MKNSFFLILLVISSNLCFAACTKNTKRIVEQDFSEDKKVSSFEDNIEAFINNDIEVINKFEAPAPCQSRCEQSRCSGSIPSLPPAQQHPPRRPAL